MNEDVFILLAAFMLNGLTLVYLFALKRKRPVNSAYILVALNAAYLSLSSLILWSYDAAPWMQTAVKMGPLAWMTCGFAFINLAYALLAKKTGAIGVEDISQDLFTNIQDGVVLADHQASIIQLNDAAKDILGLHDVNDPVNISSLLETYDGHGIYKNYETRLRTPNTDTAVSLSQTTIQQNDVELGKLLIIRDITERKRAAKALRQSESQLAALADQLAECERREAERAEEQEELVKADRLESIGVLAGGIAHDFNNILTAIIGNISLASIYAKEDEKLAKRLANVEKATIRAQDLTHQLLTFSKGSTPMKRLASVEELIQESIDFSLRGSNVRCDLHLDHELWSAEMDTGQISQVIHNLIINADQAMPNGGVLSVRAENTRVNEAGSEVLIALVPGAYVKIVIQDEGCGIAEDQRQKIFDPYYTTKEGGSGLGLFTAYNIIKQHDGHIDVCSVVDKGATFRIYLPASEQTHTSPDAIATRELAGSGHVLVMENEEEVCDVIEGILLHFGYEVVFAKDGVEAIDAYQDAKRAGTPFDAMIMDLTIPGGMGGKEALDRLRELDPHVKAIIASGYANDPIMANYRAHGFVGCIAKPYRTDTLNRALREAIGS